MEQIRDIQRGRLYAAEDSLPECRQVKYRIRSLNSAQAFVDHITASRWWRARFPNTQRVVLRQPRSNATSALAHIEDMQITVPLAMRTKLVILHELAHLAAPSSDAYAPHGPEFAGYYIELVRRFLGAEVATRLRAAFREWGVQYAPVPQLQYWSDVRPDTLTAPLINL